MVEVAKVRSAEARAEMNPGPIIGVLEAAQCSAPVSGLTHDFYRYPARFSPAFARSVIMAFTESGDTVFDPFMGGGTTLVEASVLGRRAVGTDINPLAAFVTRVKTTPLSEVDLAEVASWGDNLVPALSLHSRPVRATSWAESGYQRNISGKSTWALRKTLELALGRVNDLRTQRQRRFARCALLRTGQWALDCRGTIPPAEEFRQQFLGHLKGMISGARKYALCLAGTNWKTLSLTRSVVGIETEPAFTASFPPALILTSPPYPGVHILYHRWQVQGRRETPAPFWIASCLDGNGASYYTFGDRKRQGLASYYDHLLRAYRSLARIADSSTVLVQLVAFSDPSWQLSRYLNAMGGAGFKEIKFSSIANSHDGRVWRTVPHRKWYAEGSDRAPSGREVVLFHKAAEGRPRC